ncbi:tannase/feruloyl esterase family alpha/beta hydrolase [uncultured Aquincola sp.]|uniref:tannase/feruloyl esterase family alpha/beta hydrolase n=1 Tax=uncultured Aquincola sp. TaxID=886556 RepID=UPI0032B22502
MAKFPPTPPGPHAQPHPARWLALLAAAACTACGGSDGDDTPATPTPVALACEAASFAALKLDNATITSATPVAAGSYTPPGTNGALTGLPAFCLVKGQATPTGDSLINFEAWVPQGSAWNGKLVTTGNGGYSPALSYRDMAYALAQGYAAIGGDTGHQGDPNAMDWGLGHPEKITDWGSRSIHAITVPAKQLVATLQGQPAKRAYYYGCSTGGHQAYAQVQRYPTDFDGVIAGAPGNNRTALNAEFLWRYLSNRSSQADPALLLTPAKAALITNAAVAACDTIDGVADGVIEDPRQCTSARFDVGSLQCSGADAATCLTAAQVAAARKIYAGPVNPRTGVQIYPGQVVGSESGWPGYWGGAEPVRTDYWRLWAFENPQWNWWTFDFDRDFSFALAKVGSRVDQTSTDLSAFKAAGAKLITFQGWIDPVVVATDTIAYYEKVKAAQGSQAEVDRFFKLFVVPGMGHCSGGPGATSFGNAGTPPVVDADHDLLSALDRWVEQGTAPQRIVASRVANGAVVRTRPVCAWPAKAVYGGSGSTDDAANFSCR